MIPISPELADQLKLLNPQQLAFLAGYAWAKSTGGDAAAVSFQSQASAAQPASVRRVRILSASQTGNARKVAEQLLAKLKNSGVDAVLTAAADYKTKQLAEEDILLLVTSTQGEGEPPEEALPLHKFLNGKKAPDLSAVSFAVLGLGDSSYPKFCQAGRDFDLLLEKLGRRCRSRGASGRCTRRCLFRQRRGQSGNGRRRNGIYEREAICRQPCRAAEDYLRPCR